MCKVPRGSIANRLSSATAEDSSREEIDERRKTYSQKPSGQTNQFSGLRWRERGTPTAPRNERNSGWKRRNGLQQESSDKTVQEYVKELEEKRREDKLQ